jgi:hypothetical protein
MAWALREEPIARNAPAAVEFLQCRGASALLRVSGCCPITP